MKLNLSVSQVAVIFQLTHPTENLHSAMLCCLNQGWLLVISTSQHPVFLCVLTYV